MQDCNSKRKHFRHYIKISRSRQWFSKFPLKVALRRLLLKDIFIIKILPFSKLSSPRKLHFIRIYSPLEGWLVETGWMNLN
ncbi:TPA: hypothetical protein DCG29_03915 [Candidatus Nomurabacteria bacterium]|nr:hypothetical protein [Candidatus Nomurabacteria bacterium]